MVALELLKMARAIMNTFPPPLPSSVTGQNPNRFSSAAATACLILAAAAWGLCTGFESVSKNLNLDPHYKGLAAIGASAVSLFLLFVGSIMGILAMLLMKPGNRGSIVARSLAGLAISGVFVAIFSTGFIHARARTLAQRDAYQDLSAAAKDLDQQQLQMLKTNGQSVSLKKFSDALDQGAKTSTGDDALAYKATQAYLLRIQAVQGAYQTALSNLTAAHVLSTSNLVSRETLQERRELVQNFLKCNTNLKNFTAANEDNFQAEMARLNVSQATINEALEGFHKTAGPRQPVLLVMREQDDEMGRGMLAVLDLLDANWGRWSYDQNTRHVRFENPDAVAQYNADMKEISDAAKEQAISKNQLTKVISQASLK